MVSELDTGGCDSEGTRPRREEDCKISHRLESPKILISTSGVPKLLHYHLLQR